MLFFVPPANNRARAALYMSQDQAGSVQHSNLRTFADCFAQHCRRERPARGDPQHHTWAGGGGAGGAGGAIAGAPPYSNSCAGSGGMPQFS